MAETMGDSFVDLERHRLQLEQNVAKLRASLQHWQAWEIEYEGMKEEIQGLDSDNRQDELEELGTISDEAVFAGQATLLTPKERNLLLRDEKGNLRGSQQILGLLCRRVDYVQQNINTVFSLLLAAEKKYAASLVPSQPEVPNEEGLPLTEIYEELDEDGNVLSSSISEPGQAAPQIVEALRKAGVKELPSNDEARIPSEEHVGESLGLGTTEAPSGEKPSAIEGVPKRPSKPRKSVSFAENTKEAAILPPKVTPTPDGKNQRIAAKTSKSNATPNATGILPDSQRSGITLYDEQEDEPFKPIIPENESPEDAAMRRQMIQYNMGEVGAIVAELDLDEDGASYSDNGSDMDDYDTSSVEEDEDQFGRTKQRVLSNDYLTEMRTLEQRLKNVGPDAAIQAPASANKDMPRKSTESKPAATKGVRFATNLDIQEAKTKTFPKAPAPTPTTNSNPNPATPVSRNPIHAPTVIERLPPSTSTINTPTSPIAATEPDEYDPALVHQEISTVYHRMRNRMIQYQGGFATAREDDDDNDGDDDQKGEVPLTEAEGGPKKMSRFKAARLGKGL